MLDKKIQDALNDQMIFEMYSANIYLSMATWFDEKNLTGFANWMKVQYQEEMFHATKFYNYIDERGGRVLIGEIGGNAEELAARYIKETNYPKPVVAYIAGRLAPPEKRMGHAGAIVMGKVGTAKSKIDAFAAAGVPVAEKPSDIAKLLKL